MPQDLVMILVRRSCRGPNEILLRDPGTILYTSLWEDLAEILMKHSEEVFAWSWTVSCEKDFWTLSWTGPCEKTLSWSCCSSPRGPCMILCVSLREDLAEILMKSSKRSLHELVQVFKQDIAEILVRRSCAHADGLVQVLAWSCTGSYENVLWRPKWNPGQ